MSGLIRQHTLNDKDVLDRRRVQELFLEAAQRFSQISGHAIGDNQLRRTNFKMNAWLEMWAREARNLQFATPGHGFVVSDCILEIVHDDSYLEATLSWSLDVDPVGDSTKMIIAWPVLNGQMVSGAEDFAMCPQLIAYQTPIAANPAPDPSNSAHETAGSSINGNYNISLGNRGTVFLANGRSQAALLVFSIGNFLVKKSILSVVKVLR